MKIGIFGNGQLAWMLAQKSREADADITCFGHTFNPALQALTEQQIAGFDDNDQIDSFLAAADAVTFETENIPPALLQRLNQQDALPTAFYPAISTILTCQDRWLEKQRFAKLDVPTNNVLPISSDEDIATAIDTLRFPAILKTRQGGYDGKGQQSVKRPEDLAVAWEDLGNLPCILEEMVPFTGEVSIIAVRDQFDTIVFYPLTQNLHIDGILRLSVATVNHPLQAKAEEYISRLIRDLDYVGCIALELFEVNGELQANEIAPRVHNSGHWTMNGCNVSQFENHMLAIAGKPVKQPEVTGQAAMLNLIGRPVDQYLFLHQPIKGQHLYDYRKTAKVGRKLGHLNLVAVADAAPGDFEARLKHLISQTHQPFDADYVDTLRFTRPA